MTAEFLFQPEKEEGALFGWAPDSGLKKAFEQELTERAKALYEKGLLRSEQGDLLGGWISLGHAARLLPHEPHFTFAYALSCLNVRASGLALKKMRTLLDSYDYRGAAFGRVSALFQMRDLEGAIEAMADSLARFAVGTDIWEFVLFLAQQAGYSGAAGFSLAGRLWLSGLGKVSLYLDERLIQKLSLSEGEQKILLPEAWKKAERLLIKGEGKGFLGAEINLLAMRRMRSLSWQEKGSLYTWIEYPADPDFHAAPKCLTSNQKKEMAEDASGHPLFYQGLGKPKIYALPNAFSEASFFEVEDVFENMCWGSPVAFPEHKKYIPSMAPARSGSPGKERDFVVIVPVHGKEHLVRRTLSSLFRTLPLNKGYHSQGEIFVVNDASPEKSLNRYLEKLAKEKKITLFTHHKQKGFAVSINLALQQVDGRDVILFNSDAVAFDRWALRLLTHLRYQKAGTVTPFGNKAGQMSFPEKQDEMISVLQARQLDQLVAEIGNHEKPVELVTGNGFCMAISAECLEKTGGIREGVFAQAYGEEVDFCLRAGKKGFKHFAAENVYVYHQGQGTIGQAGAALFLRNQAILKTDHPTFPLQVWRFEESNPFRRYRRLIAERVLQRKLYQSVPVLIVSHAIGGGVTRYIAQRRKDLEKEKKTPLLLVPTREGCRLGLCGENGEIFHDAATFSFSLPEEELLLMAILRRLKIAEIEYHNFVGHSRSIRNLAEKLDISPSIFIHDHAAFCPHITLLGENERYCGEPDLEACQQCALKVFQKQSKMFQEKMPVPNVSQLLIESLAGLKQAQKILMPSHDAAQRLKHHFPEITPEILCPEDHSALFQKNFYKRRKWERRPVNHIWRIGIVGALSVWKGALMLERVAKEAQKLSLPIKFFLIGHAVNEKALEAVGVEITGVFEEEELQELLTIFDLDAAFLPSIAPETWGYALSHILEAGLFTFCFDIGSVAERIRLLGEEAGFTIPLAFPAERIGRFLIEKLQHQ